MTAPRVASRDGQPRPAALGVVLTGAMGLAAFPIFAVSALSPLIVTDLDLTRTQLGAVTTVMFLVAVVASPAAGRAVDRFGARSVLLALYVAASVALAFVASAGSFAGLAVAGIAVGIGQGAANPATNAVVSRHVLPRRRGVLLGIKQSGVPLAQFLAGAALAPLAVVLDWRLAVLLGFVLIVPSALATAVVVPEDPPRLSAGGPAGRATQDLGWLICCTLLLALAVQATNIYLPLYAFEHVGTSSTSAGILVGMVGLLGATSRIVLGRLAGRVDTPSVVVLGLALVAIVAIGTLAMAGPGAGVALWIGAALFGSSVLGFNAVAMTVVVRRVPSERAGSASGALATAMFAGFALGPLAFGALADMTGGYRTGWLACLGACVAAAVVAGVLGRRAERAIRGDLSSVATSSRGGRG